MARAKYIVILGPDGSGKTSVADHLAESLALDNVPAHRMNFSFRIMPPLSILLGRKPKKAAPEGQRDAGMVNPLNLPKALLLGIWYGVDHVLGHITLRRANPNRAVIFARSYHDFLYQRAYLNLPCLIPRFFIALGPKPDLIATPRRDPQTIHRTKPELTVEEIDQQYERIAERLKHYPYFTCIDASAGVHDTVLRIRRRLRL